MKHNFLNALFATPRLGGAHVSPDTKWVAWTWGNIGPTRQLYLAPTDGLHAPVQLTDVPQNMFVSSWSFDSRALIVGHDTDGDERVVLYKLDIATKKMMRLTEERPSYFINGGVLHPNGQYLFYGANYDVLQQKEIEQTLVYRHDLETGERKVLAAPLRAGYNEPEINRSGTHILYHRKDLHPSGRQVWLVDVDGKEDREILSFGAKVKVSARWCPSGRRAVFLVEEKNYRKVGMWYLEDGRVEWMLNDPARNIENVYMPEGSNSLVLLEVKNARVRAFLIDPETKQEKIFSATDGIVPLAKLSDATWLITYYNARQPVSLAIYHPLAGAFGKDVTGVWERVPYRQDDLVAAEEYQWQSVDGTEIRGWLYRPKGESKGLIVDVHGGPTGHNEDRFDLDAQFFVSEGFTVLQPNYRGSTGFGLAFQEAIKKEGWGGKEQEDILCGIKALIRDGIASPGKVGITGTSYGGYSAWCAVTRYTKEFIAAAAPVCGMTDLVVDYETTRPDCRSYSEEMMSGSPTQVPERYRERSPIHFVNNIKAPLLIVQGAQDPNVTPENVRAVEKELQKYSIPYEKLEFEDEGHGIRKPKNQKLLLTRLAEFFTKAFAVGNIGKSTA